MTREQIEDIGVAQGTRGESGLMLTTDENIIDIDFQVVWNINDPAKYLFNLRDPQQTIRGSVRIGDARDHRRLAHWRRS